MAARQLCIARPLLRVTIVQRHERFAWSRLRRGGYCLLRARPSNGTPGTLEARRWPAFAPALILAVASLGWRCPQEWTLDEPDRRGSLPKRPSQRVIV